MITNTLGDQIEQIMLETYQYIWTLDPTYPWTATPASSPIVISNEYPDFSTDTTFPQLITQHPAYNLSMVQSLSRNFTGYYYNSAGKIVGERFEAELPFSLDLYAFSPAWLEARRLSESALQYACMDYAALFAHAGLRFMGGRQGTGQEQSVNWQRIWGYVASLQGSVHTLFAVTPLNPVVFTPIQIVATV